jgi:hypothetical protein
MFDIEYETLGILRYHEGLIFLNDIDLMTPVHIALLKLIYIQLWELSCPPCKEFGVKLLDDIPRFSHGRHLLLLKLV